VELESGFRTIAGLEKGSVALHESRGNLLKKRERLEI
jgi:hypothetical protein